MVNLQRKELDQLFYSQEVHNDKILLPEDEARHCFRVLRKRSGDTIRAVDGKEAYYQALIEKEEIHDCQLKIIDRKKSRSQKNYYINIAIAPPKKHSRLERFVEKAVEIGVQEISFTITEDSERKNIKRNRTQKPAVSSMRQSLKAHLPKINKTVSIKDFLSHCTNKEKYIGHLNDGNRSLLVHTAAPKQEYCVLIGPEGDFTSDEIKESQDYRFQPVSLGDVRPRTETAGIVACHILNIINEK